MDQYQVVISQYLVQLTYLDAARRFSNDQVFIAAILSTSIPPRLLVNLCKLSVASVDLPIPMRIMSNVLVGNEWLKTKMLG